jgi:hypothetical protein
MGEVIDLEEFRPHELMRAVRYKAANAFSTDKKAPGWFGC